MNLSLHTPVLLEESIEGLNLHEGSVVFEGTVGLGGHSQMICEKIGPMGLFVGSDLDQESLNLAKKKLDDTECKKIFVCDNFRNIDAILEEKGIEKVDAVLLDIGLSMRQLETASRGFSFLRDEPLLMTFYSDPFNSDYKGITARDIINSWAEESISDIIYAYGEERYARRIAQEIIKARALKPIETSKDLAEIVMRSVPKFRSSRTHPATKTFQAIRIAVNDELGALREGLLNGFMRLAPNGRMAVISFHSLEDRIIKQFFKEQQKQGLVTIITKKPITPSSEELQRNSSARSAKLRIVQKS